MKTIFLAAGKSSRLAPLEDKNLLTFCGKPFLIHQLYNAYAGGLRNFIIVCNAENKETIARLLSDFSFTAQLVQQENLSDGMAGGVLAGLSLVDDADDVFVLGGNDFVHPSIYTDIVRQSKSRDGALLAKKVETYFPGGYLKITDDNTITRIIEKPGPGNEPSDLVNIVAHYFRISKDLKSALHTASSSQDDVYEVALQSLFERQNFVAVEYADVWQAIKYPWHVLDMMQVFLARHPKKNHISKKAFVADTARIRGEKVVVEDGAKIFDNAVIQGPCYIGKNTIVGNNALVRHSHIGADCTVGYNTEVARSYLHKNIDSHMAYIGDSVVDQGVNFGAYSCTANMRLDKNPVRMNVQENRIDTGKDKLGIIVGKNAQIGIHAMMMPGSTLGQNEFLHPGSVHK